jgi:copper(I)-binding protein
MRRSEVHAMKRCLLALCAYGFASVAGAAQVTLSSVWMRPASEGADARVYVDIRSDANVDLVGAATPVARKVEIVHVKTIGDPATEKVVKKYAIPGGTTTRLAYLGDHLRLVGVKRPLDNGDPVPVKLLFVDGKGKRFDVEANVVVRGLTIPAAK